MKRVYWQPAGSQVSNATHVLFVYNFVNNYSLKDDMYIDLIVLYITLYMFDNNKHIKSSLKIMIYLKLALIY